MNEAIEFLKRAGRDGRIVADCDMGIDDRAHAQAEGRVFAHEREAWFLVPWGEATIRDRERERNQLKDIWDV